MRSRVRFQAGRTDVVLLDDVTNDLARPATIQMLYHINVGVPILGDGALLGLIASWCFARVTSRAP